MAALGFMIDLRGKTVTAMMKKLEQIQTEAAEIYILIMGVIYPLFLTGGYEKLFGSKWMLFFISSGFLMLVGISMLIPAVYSRIKYGQKWKLTAVDYCFLAYLLFVLLSFCGSDYKEQAFWGVGSWNMGLITQLLLIGIYFVLSRLYHRNKTMEKLMAAAWGIACLLLLLQRFGFDVFHLYEGYPKEVRIDFVSTLGQVTWGSVYLVIGLTVMLGVYMEEKNCRNQWIERILLVIGFMTMTVLNCDSGVVAVTGVMAVVLWKALGEKEKMLRFLELLMIALASATAVGMGERIWAERLVPIDSLYIQVATSPLLPILLLFTIGFYLIIKKNRIRIASEGWGYRIRIIAYSIFLTGILAVIASLFVLCSKGILSDSRLDSYFVFNDWWGNSRGMIWRTGAAVFSDFGWWNKLFGCGPDSFSFYAYDLMGSELRAFWNNQLVPNVHNEWFGSILNYGLLGGAAYLSIFLTAAVSFLKGKSLQTAEMENSAQRQVQLGAGLAVTAYLLHNFLCYQQILGIPFLIIVIAVGCRQR